MSIRIAVTGRILRGPVLLAIESGFLQTAEHRGQKLTKRFAGVACSQGRCVGQVGQTLAYRLHKRRCQRQRVVGNAQIADQIGQALPVAV